MAPTACAFSCSTPTTAARSPTPRRAWRPPSAPPSGCNWPPPSGGEGEPAAGPAPFKERFLVAMDDDLNSAGALGVLFDLAREINRARDEGRRTEEAQAMLGELAGVLGLALTGAQPGGDAAAAGPFIELLMELRNDLRSAKQFELSDKLRERLAEMGVVLEDSAEGTRWRWGG